jgi:acid phosphatase type 7
VLFFFPSELKPYCAAAWLLQYKYANYSANFMYWGRGSVRFRLISQRADFAFALFTGGLENVRDGERTLLV